MVRVRRRENPLLSFWSDFVSSQGFRLRRKEEWDKKIPTFHMKILISVNYVLGVYTIPIIKEWNTSCVFKTLLKTWFKGQD